MEGDEASSHLMPHDDAVKMTNTSQNTHGSHDALFQNFVEADEHIQNIAVHGDIKPATSVSGINGQGSDTLKDESYHDEDLKRHKIPVKAEELSRKFVVLNSNDFRVQRSNAQKWLTKVRDSNYGWGDETARAITALYMANDDFMIKPSEKMLMSNQLKLMLFAALMRNETGKKFMGDLSLFLNALSASCHNPRNFYGQDLVATLRQVTDAAQKSSFVAPFVYLVLCLNNATRHADVEVLHQVMQSKSSMDEIGIEAMTLLVLTCMSRNQMFSGQKLGLPTSARILHRIKIEGLPENVYDLALLAQALNEAEINHDIWNRSEVMNRILSAQKPDGSFGDLLATYYVMPVLSGKSLVSIDEHCPNQEGKSLVPIEVLKNGKEEKHVIYYTLRYGTPPEMSQSVQLKVKKSASFFDVMRIAGTLNPAFKFRYVMRHDKPCVYSIGGVVNDAEKGMYWSLYVGSHQLRNITGENFIRYDGDIRSFYPDQGEFSEFRLESIF